MEWKSLVSGKLESLDLQLRLPQDWDVEVRRAPPTCRASWSPRPGWVVHLKRLYHGVLKGHEERLLVSTSHPQSGRTELGARKLLLAEKFLPDDLQWLAKGYTDGWGLGIRSQKRALDRAEELAAPFVRILTEWYRVESVQVG